MSDPIKGAPLESPDKSTKRHCVDQEAPAHPSVLDSRQAHEPSHRLVDPDVLQIVGAVADLLGLAEHCQRMFPIDRRRAQGRHRRVNALRRRFRDRLEDARAGLRIVSPIAAPATAQLGPRDVGFRILFSDLPTYQRGIEQIQKAIVGMTRAAYELETLTLVMPDEAQRYYRISEAGEPLLDQLRAVLEGKAGAVPELLSQIDQYLTKCSIALDEGDQWKQL